MAVFLFPEPNSMTEIEDDTVSSIYLLLLLSLLLLLFDGKERNFRKNI